jgi:CheY-like chemotaxis protein
MGRYLIAVVNDDKPYIDMMAEVLGDEGYSAVSCLAGAGAFATFDGLTAVLRRGMLPYE